MLFMFTFHGEELAVVDGGTFVTGQPALLIQDASGAPYAKLSTALPGLELPPGAVLIKDWSENKELVAALRSAPGFDLVFEDTGMVVEHGYVRIPIWKLVTKVAARC